MERAFFKIKRFYLRDTCIEIKTTTGNQSTHMINNLNQVDPRDDDGGITRVISWKYRHRIQSRGQFNSRFDQ